MLAARLSKRIAKSGDKAVLSPQEDLDDLMPMSKEFRAFVFHAYSRRITDLFIAIEEIALKRMGNRVVQKPLGLEKEGNALHAIRQLPATEPGMDREDVSR